MAVYGVLIAGLDTIALVLLYALTTLLANEPRTGIMATILGPGSLTEEQRYHDAVVLLLVTAGLFVARSALSIVGLWLTLSVGNAAQANLLAQLLLSHVRAPHLTRLDRNSSQTLRTLQLSVDQSVNGVVGSSVALVSNAAVMVAVLLGLVLSSPTVALTVTVYFTLLALVWVRGVRGTLARRGRTMQKLYQERFQLILQSLAAAKELQLRRRTMFYADEAITKTRAINAANRGIWIVNGSLRYVLEAALVVGALLIVGFADFVGGRSAVLPAVGLVLAAAFRLLPALNQVLNLINTVQVSGPAIDLVEEEIATFGVDPATFPREVPTPALRLEDAVRLEAVTFRYPSRTEPAMRDVNLTIHAGESIGIVGPTGSGKSTLLDVVLGFLSPDSGTITVDGTPMADCLDGWQQSIGYVPQDVYLVDDTLRANVALGWRGDDIDDEAVANAIRLAQLEDVVRELPDGLETRVGERGVRLSGGQRQRLGLARALYVSPTVLVLDEATSSLDTVTERRIVDTLEAIDAELTTVVVTHRISTVRYCDRILYLENGLVRMTGTFDELMEFTSSHPASVAAAT